MSATESRALMEITTAADIAGGAKFDVRRFACTEAISTLFSIRVTATHPSASVDFDAIVGHEAAFSVTFGAKGVDALVAPGARRTWRGVVQNLELVRASPDGAGVSTYEITLVPRTWLLSQRRNFRMFQFKSEVEIAIQLLTEWHVDVEARLDVASYKQRKYKVQYAESDYDFVSRILAEVGVSFLFEEVGEKTVLVLVDRPDQRAVRPEALAFNDDPSLRAISKYATDVRKQKRVRPTAVLLRDRDYRRASDYEVQGQATVEKEANLEIFSYPENFTFVAAGDSSDSPTSDDRGRSRVDETEAKRRATIDLEAQRGDVFVVSFESNDITLSPGVVFRIEGHPSQDLDAPTGFLVVEARTGGAFDTEVTVSIEATPATNAHRPAPMPKPRIIGLESATVVGPAGEEIHCDEFGRVRVHFHWDRESHRNEQSSCWIPVSQTWGGAGYGGVQIPRIGQEVLIEFLAGDPDRPIITGRVFTSANKIPIKLPLNKTQTVLHSKTHKGDGGNKLEMEDANGQQRLDMHAQRDMNVRVLNNRSTKIDNHETRNVGGNQTFHITKNQSTTIQENHTHNVTKNQNVTINKSYTTIVKNSGTITVDGTVSISSTEENIDLTAQVDMSQKALNIEATAGQSLILHCGGSTIALLPDVIVINSPKVLVNPGSAWTQAIIEMGGMPVEPEPPPPPAELMDQDGNVVDPIDYNRRREVLNEPPLPQAEQDRRQKLYNDYQQKCLEYRNQKTRYEKFTGGLDQNKPANPQDQNFFKPTQKPIQVTQ